MTCFKLNLLGGECRSGSTRRELRHERINKWMEGEGYDNKELASKLLVSVRAVSSLRNNGQYHGGETVTKLANLMQVEVEDLYVP